MKAKEKAKIVIKFISFLFITCLCVGGVNEWLNPEYYYNEAWPTTNTYKDFYRLEKDSVDVLMFGSSHAVSSLNPQVIYDSYGITSYNLGCEQQSLVVTYYWLREALKYQSPKVIVLDTFTLYMYWDNYVYNAMNCSEGAVRKAMDCMRFSSLKWEAGRAIEEIDPTQSSLSFPFLNIRYHTRWTNLGENDYTESSMIDHGGVKGFTVLDYNDPSIQYTPFKDADAENVEAEEMVETARTYLDKIVELCEKEDIQLILINIPWNEPVSRYKSTKEYANEHNIPYYDFDEEVLYNEIAYNVADDGLYHPNYLGAEKISLYIGRLLSDTYGVGPREDATYDKSRELYEHKIENIKLAKTSDAYQYLDLLNDDKYSVFIFGPTSYSAFLNDELMNKLYALGVTCDLRCVEEGTHYLAVRDVDGITEKITKGDFTCSGPLRKGYATYSCRIDATNMLQEGRIYSMVIAGTECGNQNAGLDIVVYDNDLKIIVDKVNVNTTVEELTMSRY